MGVWIDRKRAVATALMLGVTAVGLHGMTLEQALTYALENNYDIRTAKAAVEEQEGVVISARADRLPQLGLSGQWYANAKDIDASLPADNDTWAVTLEVTQNLYAGGRIRANVDASRASLEAALLDLQASMANALLDVRINFLNALLAREQIRVQQENVRLLDERLAQVRNRYDVGAVSNFDLLRAEVALANARPALIEARSALEIAMAELKLALGAGALETVPQAEGTLEAVAFQVDEAAAQREALEQRPELAALRRRLDAAELIANASRAGHLPSVEAFGGYDVGEPRVAGSSTTDGWRVGVRGSWALFDSGRTRGEQLQARARQRQFELALDRTRTAVSVEVTQALRTLTESFELMESARRSVQQAEEGLRLAEARFQSGVATQVDVLDAQVALTEARTNVLQANYRNNTAVARLRRAIGSADPFVLSAVR